MSVDGLMHALHRYVAARLADRIRKTRVVVFYDPRREFTPFFEQAETAGEGTGGLPQVALDGTMSHLARFKGSFFQLRYDIEPILAQPSPERLVVYIAGVERDRQNSLLMEAELGGDTYEPQFKKIAHEVLRKQLTEGQVDELLRGEVTYDDVAGFLDSGGGGASVLRTILGHESGERLLAGWLLKPSVDGDIESKGGTNELFSLLTERVGLKLTADRDLARARRSTLRYLLVNEFRMDYEGEPPAELDSVAAVPRSECKARIQKVVKELRERHADAYADGARQVQSDLQFEYSALDPTRLGRVDTFPIEEEVLLGHVAELLAEGKHAPAKKLIEERRESFWAARDMRRQSQWEVCQRIAALNSALDEARRVLARPMRDAEAWVEAYAAHDGLHRVDCLHRSLEAFCATLDDEPVAEAALAKVRFRYVDILRRMADAFTTALEASGWSVGGYQRQADTFAHLDQRSGDPVAYFLVDAFRYEMGVELADILTDVEELSVEPAIAALPTITPVGMAALMPGASSDFSVLDAGGKLASRIGATALKDWADRWRRWQALVPGVKELDLERVLRETTGQLTRAVEGAPLVLVRSQEIDLAGESDGGSVAHHVIASIVSSLARAVRKLAKAGITHFVITSDHGHLFADSKDDDMKTDPPGGNTLLLHRRCWVGRGGTDPAGTVRLSAADLGYDSDLDFVFPRGTGVFRAGGGLRYHHGGLSLQELVVPVLRVRMPAVEERAPATQVELHDVPEAITTRAVGVTLALGVDLFTEPASLRVVLMDGDEEVGQAGMATGGRIDPGGVIQVAPNSEVSVGLMLTRDDCRFVRIVVFDPESDAILAQTGDIPVRISI